MLQEHKELLLKDLCARLPYKVKISIPELFTNKEQVETLNEIFKGNDDLYRVNDSGIFIEYIKPYLFPLSSMTEEQEEEYNDLNNYELGCFPHTEKALDYLLKNHFDYRYLIDEGLAIDATGLNIY